MKKLIVISVLFVAMLVWGQTQPILNTRIAMQDTVYVDSTSTVYSEIFWQTEGEYKTLLIEAYDDSTAGITDDSACIKIELLQAFNIGTKHIVLKSSHAYPDCTSYAYSDSFLLYDSLSIQDMDTTSMFIRNALYKTNPVGDTIMKYYGVEIDSMEVVTPLAYSYRHITPDYSPGLVLKITGLTPNLARGTGSRWIFRWYQQKGQPVYNK